MALAIEGADVLEVGCGTGKNTEWLVEHARSVLALDFSTGMLDKARARVRSEGVRFVQHDVREPWPAAPSSVDVVVTNLVLEHVEQIEPFFRQAATVLRSGGRLFVCAGRRFPASVFDALAPLNRHARTGRCNRPRDEIGARAHHTGDRASQERLRRPE